jgi:hypothetical protein
MTSGGFLGGRRGGSPRCADAATDIPATRANINNICFTNFITFLFFLFAKSPHRGKRETCVAFQLSKAGAKDSSMTQMPIE